MKTRVRRDRHDDMKFYCSWGRHDGWRQPGLNVHFPTGTACLECQLMLADNIVGYMNLPELGVALHALETRRRTEKLQKKATVKRIVGNSDEAGFVYYIRINGQIKIGYAADVTARMRHYPPGSELLAVEPGTLKTERERHQDFKRHLVRGREWFNEGESLTQHIAYVVETCGDPKLLAYEYTSPTRR